jgi:hypothetical protein
MAAPAHNKFILNGSMPGGEIWSVGIAVSSASQQDVTTQAALQLVINDDASGGTWAAALTGFMAKASSLVSVTELKAVYYNGLGVASAVATRPAGVPGQTVAASSTLPNECAVVASFRTTSAGPSGRGRIYMPQTMIGRNNDGTILAADAITVRDGCKQLLTKIRAAFNASPSGGGDFNTVVASGAGIGALHLITEIRLGNVIDSQRRRRNRQKEVYITTPIP